MKKVIVIVGPTAVGKTKVAIALAKKLNLEVISGDSVAVYKSLDIGSAKPSTEEQEGIVHHLIDTIKPTEQFDVATFQKMARDIIDKSNISLICGGTGLYISSVLFDYDFKAPSRSAIFDKRYENFTNEELFNLLLSFDSHIDREKIHPHNRKRVLRALEVFTNTDSSISSFNNKREKLYDSYIIYLNISDRKVLYDRINKRVDLLMDAGLLKEVRDLYNKGIYPNAIGYKEFIPYFNNTATLDEVVENIKKNTRHLAKKQMTWFKNQLNSNFYEMNLNDTGETIEKIYQDVLIFLKE